MLDRRSSKLIERRQRALADLPELSEVLRGSLVRRFVRCGKSGCRCHKGQGHGPFVYLTVTLGVGRSQQITIAPEDYELARRYVDNYSRLKDALEKVSSINRELLRARSLPRSPPPTAAPPAKRRRSSTTS
jgi:hypothetical protein